MFFVLQLLEVVTTKKSHILISSGILIAYNSLCFVISLVMKDITGHLKLFENSTNLNKFYYYGTISFHTEYCATFMMMLSCAYFELIVFNKAIAIYAENSVYSSLTSTLKKLLVIHDKFCDVFESISKFYFINVLIVLLVFMYFCVASCYILFVFLMSPEMKTFFFLLVSVLWTLFYSPCVFWILTFSSWIESEGLKSAFYVSEIQRNARNINHSKISNIFMLQIMHRRPKVSCGMFDLNWKFSFGLLCSIFSFSIILIQFYDVKK